MFDVPRPAVLQADWAALVSSVRASLLEQRQSALVRSVQSENLEVSMPPIAAVWILLGVFERGWFWDDLQRS